MCEWEGAERGEAGRRCARESVCVRERLRCGYVQEKHSSWRVPFTSYVHFWVFWSAFCVRSGAKAPGQRPWWSHLFIVRHSRLPPTCCFHCESSSLFYNSSAHIFSIFFPLTFSHMLLTASAPAPLLLLVPLASTLVNFLLFTFLSVANILIFPWRKKDNCMYISSH